ncbi:hypothetical protein OIE66_27840 [Nonomuraea sp. NBC_01738]|uniref:hypothetical protein n=1 Tax=Nonomuraea sp. NBC_01738 TaxID=2976003 RepID=UPI002E15CD17|nr:hypothetical protein OIE66_27840 [Nonomuraea sp. NBC_01738]
MPQVVGQGLSSAVDELGRAGHGRVKTTDVSGRGRVVVARSGWRVCAQHAAPGQVALDVVKLGETCPGRTARVPAGTMPELAGKSIRVSRQSLPRDAKVKISDATGQNRITFHDTAWQVCTQSPSAGSSLGTKQAVSLAVVKYEETCP